MAIHVFLVDDHELMREGLKTVLKNHPEIVVVGEAGSFAGMVEKLGSDEVDLLILDINLPDKSGMEVLRYLKQQHPDIRILVLSMHPEEVMSWKVVGMAKLW